MTIPGLFLDLDHPIDIARRFRTAKRPNLIRQNELWYDYTGTHYAEVEHGTIESAVQEYLAGAFVGKMERNGDVSPANVKDGKPKPLPVAPYNVRQVVESLEKLPDVHKPADTYKSPSWLTGKDRPHVVLPCRNGLLDLEKRKLLDHTPEFFCTYCLDLEYKPDVPVPARWLTFLSEVYTGRQHLIDALQEAFGYIISGDRSLEKGFYFRGVSGSGKGVIFRVAEGLVGTQNTETLSYGGSESTLGEKHGLAHVENALLLQIPDVTFGKHDGGHKQSTTRLKEILSNDRTLVRPLYGKAVSMRLPGAMMMASNDIPNFGTNADALARRWLFWPHDVSFKDDSVRDDTLKKPDKSPLLTVEALTGILNWSLAGLDRLNKRGRFEEWPESLAIKREMLRQSNLTVAFITDCCTLAPGRHVEKSTLHHVYRDWCADRDKDWKSEEHFSAQLTIAANMIGATLSDKRGTRDADGNRPREWVGISLNRKKHVAYYEHDAELIEMLSPDGKPCLDSIVYDATSGRPVPKQWTANPHERKQASPFDDDDGEEGGS